MSNIKKLMMSSAGGAGIDVDEVFSTYLYTGNGTSQTITNGLDLAGEGGLIWNKYKSGSGHLWYDTERGIDYIVGSHSDEAQYDYGGDITSVNSDGFSFGYYSGGVNYSGRDYVTWSFRKAPKFFDIVTYTGTGSAGLTVSHNLGATPGVILIKCTSSAENWRMWHTDFATNESIMLNNTGVKTSTVNFLNNTSPTSTTITLGNHKDCNASGDSYVMYLFAHNNSDGGFGPDGDQDIIKCGSWTASSSSAVSVNLGFEPQWVLIKKASGTSQDWLLWDTMRGMPVDTVQPYLSPNSTSGEGRDTYYLSPTATGFTVRQNALGSNGDTYIYIAIRRGPLFPPENGTDVFDMDFGGQTSPTPPLWSAGFNPDFALERQGYQTTTDNFIVSRLTQGKILVSNNAFAEINDTNWPWFDVQNGVSKFGYSVPSWYAAMWRRAPNYFDVTTYTGTGSSSLTVDHSLGVVPEMIWVRRRNGTSQGKVYHKDLTNTNSFLYLNSDAGEVSNQSNVWPTAPTDTQITIGNYTGDYTGGGDTGIAYLFASLDGVSKVGSYSGNGSSQTINCGFTGGARFVLIKRVNGTGGWLYYDTLRGINAGDDPRLRLDSTAYAADTDAIDAHSSGFSVNNDGAMTNASGATYIFYAIA
jgi:hypothetical protein